jgi:phenylalanyl-tRNA synthetase beta chain
VAEALLQTLGFSFTIARASWPGFHPGKCADIKIDGRSVGRLGELHPDIAQKYDLKQQVVLFDIDLSALGPRPAIEKKYRKISRFPYSERDIAVVVDEKIEAASLNAAIAEAGGDILQRVLLFDIYRGAQVEAGKKSLAFSLRFQSYERTLTDEEVSASFERIVRALEQGFSAQLRK